MTGGVARGKRHPLIAAARKALPHSRADTTRAFLSLLDRRLRALDAAAASGAAALDVARRGKAERALARRVLRPLEGRWDDGDENLVRGELDRWLASGEDPVRAAARGLSEAARMLAEVKARPETLWFFLWEMESILDGFNPLAAKRKGTIRE